MQQLVNASQTATGRMQAIQVGNQIAAQLVDEMQKLRQLLMTQIQVQSQYISEKQDKEDCDAALSQSFYQAPELQLWSGPWILLIKKGGNDSWIGLLRTQK